MDCKVLTPDLGLQKACIIKEFTQTGGQHHGEKMVVLRLKDRSLSIWQKERISLKKDLIRE